MTVFNAGFAAAKLSPGMTRMFAGCWSFGDDVQRLARGEGPVAERKAWAAVEAASERATDAVNPAGARVVVAALGAVVADQPRGR